VSKVRLSDVRLSDVRLSDVRLSDIRLSDVRLSVALGFIPFPHSLSFAKQCVFTQNFLS